MAPNLKQVEQQTFEVLQCLFEDEAVGFRSFANGEIETDGPEDDGFDPVLIADKLKAIADTFHKDPQIQATMDELDAAVKELKQEALDQALSSSVETLVKSHVGQRAEVAHELQIIQASMALGLYMKKTYPNMKSQLQSAIGNFLNQRVGSWITQQGGWARVSQL